MNKKTLLPLIAAGIMAGTFTIAAAETNGTNVVSRAQPKVAVESTEAVSEVADPELVKRAEAGDTEAQRELGLHYLVASFQATGEKAAELERTAKLWQKRLNETMAAREGDFESVRKRAEAGDPAAQRALGFRYSQGVDVEKDEKKGFEWTKKAALRGDAKAMLNLASNFAKGSGTAKNETAAVAWYRKAAEAFLGLAKKGEKLDLRPLVQIGQDLLDGESRDAPEVGMMFLGVAAQGGDAKALRLAGEQFAIGKAVERDYDTALLLLRKAS